MGKRLLLIFTAAFIGCFSTTAPLFAAPDAGGDTITDRLENSENNTESEENGGINTQQIKQNAENFSLEQSIANIEDMSLKMLMVWVIAAGILMFFKWKWAMGLLFLGFLGFAVINYYDTVVSLLMGVADWVAETLQSG
ncbi:hypothetical protein [Salibacterium aidingense]|uniref:hypothetical protein n=1 Tax=Salibacterium aidingense TaxID=384933 RepID=UPI0004137DCD|nr:hypothetical protein [Salibacterium aidingense]